MRGKPTILISIILAISFISPVMVGSQISDEDVSGSVPPIKPLALFGKKICVDPGHGGSDTGTTGIDGPGYPDEKNHNLDMGLHLRNLLEAKGASVYMTRTTDVDVSLQGRCDIANNNNTDIFVSIHCNSVGVETVSGTETFYWGVDAVTYSVNGKRLAENVQTELVDHLGSNDRGAKADLPYFGFHLYVLDHTIMPAILTEVGFMSNQTEFDLLNQTWYRQEAAQAMFDGIMTYYRSSHAPIRIDSNADFDEAHGVVNWETGDGSQGNPWIIENWDINGTGYGYCIYVGNTTEHFAVRDCVLHNANGFGYRYYPDSGIALDNSKNGIIENNSVHSNNEEGIDLEKCSYIDIYRNDISSNFLRGMYIEECNNITVYRNDINSNTDGFTGYGIVIYGLFGDCSWNLIHNNTISNNGGDGVLLYCCSQNTLADNNITNNEDFGIYFSHQNLVPTPPCDYNLIKNNNISSNGDAGIYSRYSTNNTISDNILWENNDGMLIFFDSNYNVIQNNMIFRAASSGLYESGIYLKRTLNNVISNNTMNYGGIFLQGIAVEYWNTHIIDSLNTLNGNAIHYWKNRTSGILPLNAGQIIIANCSNLVVEDQTIYNAYGGIDVGFSNNISILNNEIISNPLGVYIYQSSNNTFRNNNLSSNDWGLDIDNSENNDIFDNDITVNGGGIALVYSAKSNTIANNDISSNYDGIYFYSSSDNVIVNNTFTFNNNSGIIFPSGALFATASTNNLIMQNDFTSNECGITISTTSVCPARDNYFYHNNFINNSNQTRDNDNNYWHNGYPSGGNYWSDYAGVDNFHGPNQDIPGSDGIGDTNYTNIQDGSNVDEYPLMSPFDYTEFEIPLQQGWNLISLPTRQLNSSIDSVLESIAGKWDCIQTYDPTTDSWLSNNFYRPASLNDLNEMNHLHGYWVNITKPGVTLTVKGDRFNSSLSIPLKAGWNLVGYPSLVEKSISDALAGTGYDRVEGFNSTAPYRLSQLSDSYMMKPGEPYWIHVPADMTWVVDW